MYQKVTMQCCRYDFKLYTCLMSIHYTCTSAVYNIAVIYVKKMQFKNLEKNSNYINNSFVMEILLKYETVLDALIKCKYICIYFAI